MSDEVQKVETGSLFEEWDEPDMGTTAAQEMALLHGHTEPEPEKMDDSVAESDELAPESEAEVVESDELEETVDDTAESSDEPTGTDGAEADEPSGTAFSEDVLKEIRRRVNGVIESDDDVYAHLDRLSERDSALSQIEQLYQSNPDLLKLAEMLESGTDFSVAALSLVGEVDPEPDVDDDPKAWAEWKLRQDKAAEQRKAGQKAAAEAEAKRKANSEQVLKHYEEFVRANSLTSEQAEQYARDYQVLLNGDPVTGKRRRDEHDVIWKGLNFDAEVQKRVAAELEKIKGGLKPDASKKKLQGDGLPKGGGGKPNAPSKNDREMAMWIDGHERMNHRGVSSLEGDFRL